MKKILIINTGGTIDCAATPDGLVPRDAIDTRGFLDAEFADKAQLEYMRTMCLDSADLQPEHWLEIARTVERQQWRFDGILITHGTDTMAYTSSALWYMLGGIRVPVVLTGAQIPASREDSDAHENLRGSMAVLLSDMKPGIYVVFGGRIIGGRRATKRSSTALDAFASVNFPDIGSVSGGKVVLSGADDTNGGTIAIGVDSHVLLLKIAPGVEAATLYAVKALGYKAVLLEGYGLGGIPSKLRNFIPAIKHLNDGGVVTVLTTQCPEGICEIAYEAAVECASYGMLCAGDMSTESALVKLMWLFREDAPPERVREDYLK